jgi:hypothetical protein
MERSATMPAADHPVRRFMERPRSTQRLFNVTRPELPAMKHFHFADHWTRSA